MTTSKRTNKQSEKHKQTKKQTNTKTRKHEKKILLTNKPTRNQIVKSINKQRSNKQLSVFIFCFLFYLFIYCVLQSDSSLCAYLYGVRKRNSRSNAVQLASRE